MSFIQLLIHIFQDYLCIEIAHFLSGKRRIWDRDHKEMCSGLLAELTAESHFPKCHTVALAMESYFHIPPCEVQ